MTGDDLIESINRIFSSIDNAKRCDIELFKAQLNILDVFFSEVVDAFDFLDPI